MATMHHPALAPINKLPPPPPPKNKPTNDQWTTEASVLQHVLKREWIHLRHLLVDPATQNITGDKTTKLVTLLIYGEAPIDILRVILWKGKFQVTTDDLVKAMQYMSREDEYMVAMFQALLEYTTPEQINASWNGFILLHQAIMGEPALKSLQLVRLLLEHGANPNLLRNDDGGTALHQAILFNHVGIVKLLLSHGADANACSSSIMPPLHVAIEYGTQIDMEIFRYLLTRADANMVAVQDGYTPLHRVLQPRFVQVELVEILLSHGANPNFINSNQPTLLSPLGFAIANRCTSEVINILIAAGGDCLPYMSQQRVQLIVAERALIQHLLSHRWHTRCAYCLNPGKSLAKCKNCILRYCNLTCQRDHWPVHQHHCRDLNLT